MQTFNVCSNYTLVDISQLYGFFIGIPLRLGAQSVFNGSTTEYSTTINFTTRSSSSIRASKVCLIHALLDTHAKSIPAADPLISD